MRVLLEDLAGAKTPSYRRSTGESRSGASRTRCTTWESSSSGTTTKKRGFWRLRANGASRTAWTTPTATPTRCWRGEKSKADVARIKDAEAEPGDVIISHGYFEFN